MAALEGLDYVLKIFEGTQSHDVISVLTRGLSAGPSGRRLIEVLNALANSPAFTKDIQSVARTCSDLLSAFFNREHTLYDHCLVTLIDHPPGTNLDAMLGHLDTERMPIWLINPCSSDRPPSLTALLAWMQILTIEGFADEIDLMLIIQRHQRPSPGREEDTDDPMVQD